MDILRSGKRLLWRFVPPYNDFLYRICKRYVDQYNADNNDNFKTNGELWFIGSVLPECSVVFDVGANIGDWAALAVGINPNATVHCFEPSRAAFDRLRGRALKNVVCNNWGLSSEPREGTLSIFSDEAGTNSLYYRQGLEGHTQRHTEKVSLDTIDSYYQALQLGDIDLLKVDVEGHELEVFRGGREAIKRGRIKRIQFEYGGCNIDSRSLLKDIFDFFEPYSYVFHKLYPNRLKQVIRYNQRLETFQYQNWVLLRKDLVSTLG
jgi:FkbM family methyltransferase